MGTTFAFNINSIRVIDRHGNPWFAVADVRTILGLAQHGQMLDRLDADEKTVIRKSGSTTLKGRGLAIISESGLYKLVLRSDKAEAKPFQDWVTKVVLPAIRKDGAVRWPGWSLWRAAF